MSAPLQAGLDVCARRLAADDRGPLAVAFSGGGDSLALLLVACAFRARTGRSLVALHVDHGLQSPSALWAVEAASAAERLGVPFRGLRWEGPKPAAGLPAAARAARHRLIAEAARQAGATTILLGHTLDDQLENAVMRGAGAPVGALREWSASPVWPEGRGLFHCRPLLAVRRAALRRWLTSEGLGWLDDPANDDLRYARARARAFIRDSASAEPPPAADIFALAELCQATPWGGCSLDRAGLLDAAPDQARRLLQIALACASGVEALARPQRAKALLNRLRAGERFTAALAGARVEAGEAIDICREAGEAARGGLRPIVLQPGVPSVWDGRFEALAGEAGWGIAALRGLASRLSAADRAHLRRIPAFARPALPILVRGEAVHLALTGSGAQIDVSGTSVHVLAQARFAGAVGLVTKEDRMGTFARMAQVPLPPYLGRNARTSA